MCQTLCSAQCCNPAQPICKAHCYNRYIAPCFKLHKYSVYITMYSLHLLCCNLATEQCTERHLVFCPVAADTLPPSSDSRQHTAHQTNKESEDAAPCISTLCRRPTFALLNSKVLPSCEMNSKVAMNYLAPVESIAVYFCSL